MTVHTKAGDAILGKRLVYEARKVSSTSLIRKGGKHRGLRGKLYDAKCWIETPIQKA
ncbi:MAG: hypothetical protein ACE5R6_07630 [Candidatus Heimdallarchaeota archaeon]